MRYQLALSLPYCRYTKGILPYSSILECENFGNYKVCPLGFDDEAEHKHSMYQQENHVICYPCPYLDYRDGKICKSTNSLEIKPETITIGRKEYQKQFVDYLKVDYEDGNSYVLEYGEECEGAKE